jgi:hypothetical protein
MKRTRAMGVTTNRNSNLARIGSSTAMDRGSIGPMESLKQAITDVDRP